MPDNKKYYWLKLKEDFFDDDAIQWIEEQPNGSTYALLYLKLCVKSLKGNGLLIRSVGDMLIPYDAKKIAELTRTDIDTVRIAMELFKKAKLVQILDNGEIYLTQLENMVGSESKWAKYKRNNTALENFQSNSKMIPKKLQTEIRERDRDLETRDRELEIEKELEKDINKELINEQVESIWKRYPKKKGKGTAVKKIAKIINQYGYEQITRCIDRYKQEIKIKKTTEQYIQHGSTFFNNGYIDYLDQNYSETKENVSRVCYLKEE